MRIIMQMSTAIQKNQLTGLFLLPVVLSLFLAISAQISVALYPVPITLQSLVILLVGLLCSPQVAALSVGYYIAEIAFGLPFASNFSGGLAALISPKAGFFMGFLAAAFISAKMLTYLRSRSFITLIIAATVSTGVLYASGIAWLSILFGFEKAIVVGLYPFLTEIPAFISMAVVISYQINHLILKSQR